MKRIEHFSIIAPDMGHIFQMISISTCIPLIIAMIYQEWDMLLPMATVPVTLFAIGTPLSRMRRMERRPSFSVALSAVAIIWLVCAICGAIPFTLGIGMPYLDAVFEAMSGWTSTGLTLSQSLDTMPHTLLFWRSLMQWLGGLGIVAFTIAMASRSGLAEFRLYRSEGRPESFMPGVVATGLQMWKIYVILTIISTGLILASGIPLWDAANTAMTAIATGGFSLHDSGILYYNNRILELAVIPVMIAGALPFKIYYLMYRERKMGIFHDEQAKLLFTLIAVGVAVIALDLIAFSHLDGVTALRQGLFMTVSGITCTGFQIASPHNWANATVLTLAFLMLIGGASGSTAGGIKLNRIALGIDGIVWWFRRMFASGKTLVPFRHEGRSIQKNIADLEVSKNMLVLILYILVVFGVTVTVMHLQQTAFESSNILFEVISAMSNVGISTGYVSPAMAPAVKLAFIFTMWIGRLEIVPVIILIWGALKGYE